MPSTLPPGWHASRLNDRLVVVSNGTARPVYLRTAGNRTRICVYHADGRETVCRDLGTACRLAGGVR